MQSIILDISNRIGQTQDKLYVQIEGFDFNKFKTLTSDLVFSFDFLYCISAEQILSAQYDIVNEIFSHFGAFQTIFKTMPQLVITGIDQNKRYHQIFIFEGKLQRLGIRVWEHYSTSIFDTNFRKLFSENGIGNNDHIPVKQKLVFVSEYVKNSSAFGCCVSQLFCDQEIGGDSTFAFLNLSDDQMQNPKSELCVLLDKEYNLLARIKKYLGSAKNLMQTYKKSIDLLLG